MRRIAGSEKSTKDLPVLLPTQLPPYLYTKDIAMKYQIWF